MMEKLFDLPLPALLLGQQDVIYLTTIISIFFCFLFPIISLLMAFETYYILKCAIEWNTEQIMVNLYFSYKFFIWPQKGPSICSVIVTYILKNIFFPPPPFLFYATNIFHHADKSALFKNAKWLYMLHFASLQSQEQAVQVLSLECRKKQKPVPRQDVKQGRPLTASC